MKTSSTSIRQFILGILFLTAFAFSSHAQCPSVVGTGEPAVLFLSGYGMPGAIGFREDSWDYKFSVPAGLQIGVIASPAFQIQFGAELSSIRRTYDPTGFGLLDFEYNALVMELPLELRFRLGTSSDDSKQTFFTLGAGLVLITMKEHTDPFITLDEMFYENFVVRVGFENTITVADKFNILWGLIGKVDPIAMANDEHSIYTGTYFVGAKLGIQLGF